MKGMLKWPLIIAAIFVIGRVALERSGAGWISNFVSVSVLHMLIFPLYFAWRISNSGISYPYRALLKNVTLFAVLARLMVVPTYWLAYIYQWPAARFSEENVGVVGPGVTPLGAFLVPLGLAFSWIIGSVIIGGAVGSIVIAVRRRGLQTA